MSLVLCYSSQIVRYCPLSANTALLEDCIGDSNTFKHGTSARNDNKVPKSSSSRGDDDVPIGAAENIELEF